MATPATINNMVMAVVVGNEWHFRVLGTTRKLHLLRVQLLYSAQLANSKECAR